MSRFKCWTQCHHEQHHVIQCHVRLQSRHEQHLLQPHLARQVLLSAEHEGVGLGVAALHLLQAPHRRHLQVGVAGALGMFMVSSTSQKVFFGGICSF